LRETLITPISRGKRVLIIRIINFHLHGLWFRCILRSFGSALVKDLSHFR